jgi:hypothetical protein
VSLSWRDRVAIAIYPERVVWLRGGRGLRSVVSAKGSVPCTLQAGSSWRGALAVLPDALTAAGAANTRVSVLLSNRLMRYAITPNPDSANSREELDGLVRHVFERTHGEAASSWDIRLSDALPGRPALASAVDRELMAALRDAVAASGGQLASIQPYLMAAFNRMHGLSASSGIFVLVEPERLCQLAWKHGGWSAVQQIHADSGWPLALHDMLDRMAMSQDLDATRPVRLCAQELNGTAAANGRWQIETVLPALPAGLSPIDDRAYTGAMLALN